MDRQLFMKQVGCCLVIVAMLAGVAWADPTGTANLAQILNPSTHDTTTSLSRQRTFLTTDSIAFEALYYDPNPFCAGINPASTLLLLISQEGRLLFSFPASAFNTTIGTRYRALFRSFASAGGIPLPPGTYRFTCLVTDCTGTFQVVLPDAPTFSIFAP